MFCRYCGKPLQDGEVCDCSQAAAARSTAANAGNGEANAEKSQGRGDGPSGPEDGNRQPVLTLVAVPPRPGRVRRFFRNVWQCFLSYFTHTVPTLGTSARIRDWKTGSFWAGVQAVLAGLFGMACARGVTWSLSSSLPTLNDTMGSMRGGAQSSSGYSQYILAYLLSYVHVRYLVVFLLLFAGSLLGWLGLSAAGYGMGAALRRRPPFASMLAAAGVCRIPSACLIALAAVFSLFWPAAGAFFAIAALITLLINTYAATKTVCGTDNPRLMLYYGPAAAVVTTLLLLLGAHFGPSIFFLGGR